MDIKNIISIASVISFIVFILLGINAKRNYLLFVVFAFPVIDLFITPLSMGGFKVFDIITYLVLLFLIKKQTAANKPKTLYPFFFFVLTAVLFIGCLHSEFIKDSLISFIQFMSVFIYAALLLDECYRYPEFTATIIKGLKLSCLLSLVFLAMQLIFGLKFALYELNPNASSYDAMIRYPSFFQDPQKYGQFLSICSFLFLIENKEDKQSFLLNTLFFAGVVVGLFLSGVRAAFSGLCLGMLAVFFLAIKNTN